MEFDNGIVLEDVEQGLLVRQYEDAYIARRWRLTDPTISLVKTAIGSGLRWMIRQQHPQSHARWPSSKGRAYLAFSPTREDQWSMAIDTVSSSSGNYGHAVFNGKYHYQFEQNGVPFEFEKRNRNSGHMKVMRSEVLPTLELLSQLDHSVLYLGRSGQPNIGFVTEYDIQRFLLLQ